MSRNFKTKKSYNKRQDYMDNYKYSGGDKPTEEKDVKNYLSTKALSGLPHSSYSVTADPYTAALPTSEPYPLIARFNKAVGGNFAGNANIDGGNVQQYANSIRSKFLKYFDFMKLKLSVNYRYLPSRLNVLPEDIGPDNDYVGSGLIDQARQSIAEATSTLQSTTFTQMAIYDYVVETDLPMGTAIRSKAVGPDGNYFIRDGKQVFIYTNLSDVIYAALRYYQVVLQDVINVLNWHNSFRLKMGTCIRSSWNRETPSLNSLFSLFKKKSWLALCDSIALSIPGEYVDVEWAKQMSALNAMPSRRSNSITDPVMEVQTRLIAPSVFRLYLRDSEGKLIDTTPIFDDAVDMVKAYLGEGSKQTISMWDAIDDINNHLSAEYVMSWARSSDINKMVDNPDNAYFNYVKTRFDVISLCLTTFKTKFNDIREVLDVVARTGLVTWTKGFRPTICADTDAALFDNKLVDNIYEMIYSGPTSISMDNRSKRWRTYSLWNMYSGIPEYDAYSGGSFLTFSGKYINTDDDEDRVYKYVPQMFIADETIIDGKNAGVVINCVARDGVNCYIKAESVLGYSNLSLSRLFPLPSMSGLNIRVPVVHSIDGETLTQEHKSTLLKTCTQVFNFVKLDGNDTIYIEPDILSIYDIEIEDVTNDSIAYARATAPFRGSTGYDGVLGFNTFGVK